MTEKQIEMMVKDDTPPAAVSGAVVVGDQKNAGDNAQKILEISKKPEGTASKGEKVFNWTAYTGLNYWVNLVSSIAIADYFVNLGGRDKLNDRINSTARLLEKFKVPIKKAHHNSKIGWETFALTSGGLILLAPLKWMEDNKRPIVHWLNKKFGVEQKTADGREKTPEEIHIEQEQPKQSWGNVILRRIAGTAAVVAVGMGLDHFARGTKILDPEHHNLGGGRIITHDSKVQGGKDRVTDFIFDKINNVSGKLRGKRFDKNEIVSRWTKFAILDSVFTVITAVVMKMTNGAKKGKMPQEIDDSNDPPVIDDRINRIVTADERAENHKMFCDKVGKRAKDIIDYKRSGKIPSGSFIDSVQKSDSMSAGISV